MVKKITTVCIPEELINDKKLIKKINYCYNSFSNFVTHHILEFKKKNEFKEMK